MVSNLCKTRWVLHTAGEEGSVLFLWPPTTQVLEVSMQGISAQLSSLPLCPQVQTSKQPAWPLRMGTWMRASTWTRNSEASPSLQPDTHTEHSRHTLYVYTYSGHRLPLGLQGGTACSSILYQAHRSKAGNPVQAGSPSCSPHTAGCWDRGWGYTGG